MSTPNWLLPTTTITLGVLGVAALVAAFVIPSATTEEVPEQTPEANTPAPSPSASVSQPRQGVTPISELADTEWLARTARANNIPERALAAYAGAALYLEETEPRCGIGWNTLAAVALVESEHGSKDGALIDQDGIAVPDIVGDPEGESGAEENPLGPFQFLPSFWESRGLDGNRDGDTDIHNIDDAALTAAVYLCEAGGDLREPDNWIAAVDALNPSTEYNNQVAEAANRYAELG